ncbi:MAG: hypothetical protein ABWZ53_11405 [Actinomycetota bacterium]
MRGQLEAGATGSSGVIRTTARSGRIVDQPSFISSDLSHFSIDTPYQQPNGTLDAFLPFHAVRMSPVGCRFFVPLAMLSVEPFSITRRDGQVLS